jgi:3-hydroxy acid dehydrogenase / malonic semialdehyde reductase
MDRIILISGASSGFGKAIAEKFAAGGDHVIITGRRKERLDELAREITTRGNTRVHCLCFDIRHKAEVDQAVRSLPEEWKKIDVLVNNAGLAAGRDYFDEADMEDWENMIDTNVKGLLYLSKAVIPLMTARGKGHIINIGSTAAKEVYEKGNVYCATKSAVDAISQSMRIDMLRHGIKVTAVHPGAAETEFSLVRLKGDADKAKAVYAGFRPLAAEDVAEVVHYCTSLPEHVCINDLILTATAQANSFYFHRV